MSPSGGRGIPLVSTLLIRLPRTHGDASSFGSGLDTTTAPQTDTGGFLLHPIPQVKHSRSLGGTLSPDLGNGMDEWMQTAFADHLDLARSSALIAEEDLGAGVVALGGSLAVLQRDLLKLPVG